MLIGPAAKNKEIEQFRAVVLVNPGNISLSRHRRRLPARLSSMAASARHIDLRPFVLSARGQTGPGG